LRRRALLRSELEHDRSMTIGTMLLASHDTSGARAAEAAGLDMTPKDLHHLVVVPDFWKGMKGDDWLNNAITRDRFGSYVENQLQREISEHMERLEKAAAKLGIAYSSEVLLGKPALCLLAVSAERNPDLVVIGAPRPKGISGYRSRMALDILTRGLKCPLQIIPHPGS